MRDFTHLHCASGYSLRYGAAFPAALVERAAELGMRRLALTDRDGLFGAVRFVTACQAVGIAPILGADLPLVVVQGSTSRGGQSDLDLLAGYGLRPGLPTTRGRSGSPAFGGATVDLRPPRVTVLARGSAGMLGLNRLISARHELGGITPAVVREVAEICADSRMAGGLQLLLGPDSDVGRAVAERRVGLAQRLLADWRASGADVAIEVVSQLARDPASAVSTTAGLRSHGLPLSTAGAARIWRFAIENGCTAVLTNAVRHVEPQQGRLLDVLDATRRLVPISGAQVDRANGEGYLKSAAEMWQVAVEINNAAGYGESELVELWSNTDLLAERCELDPQLDLGVGSVHVPELDVILGGHPQSVDTSWRRPAARRRTMREVNAEAAAADQVLRARCEAAIDARYRDYPQKAQLQQRLTEELQVIATLGFAAFFLTVAEVVSLTRQRGVRVAARGSGAGSLANHLLGISVLNPIEHGLIMERFLSPLRSSLPDIDIDVESHRRLEVYDAVIERFGADRVACVSMMETYRVRHAIRDVGGALGMPASEIDLLAKSFPHIRARDARMAFTELPELRRSNLGELYRSGRLDALFDLVEGLDGLPRHVALHPCGVLLSDSNLLDRTPVQPSAAGFPMSQYDKDDVETLGLLKLDILGIRMQSAMSHAVAEIQRVEAVEIELDSIPLDDQPTYELIQSTKTLGCFQIESPGQRELVGKFAPENFNDIIIDISLFRPGPVKSDMVTPFLNARQGWRPAEYLHPRLRPVLAQTCGVVVFHEQVIGVVAELTGCTLAEADEVRRALGDWDQQPKLRSWFYPAALKRGFDLEVVEKVWEVLRAFASFGFCKAHAGAFALPTYQSAWLKAHHPAAFYAGVLTHDPGMYPRRLILDDARQFGVQVLGLDVNASRAEYIVESLPDAGQGIRIPFSQVKGISDAEVESLVAAQPFTDINDVWHRSEVSRPVLERLVLAGALDLLHGVDLQSGRRSRGKATRRDLLVHVADLDRFHARTASVDELLFTDLVFAQPLATGLPEMDAQERLAAELEILGMDVSHHILDFHLQLLAALGVTRSRDLLNCRSGSEVLIAGVKVATQTPPVRSGRRVVFLTLDDSTGPLDATFFEDAQGPYSHTLFHSWLLLVRGVVRRTGPRGISIRATGCWDLVELQRHFDETAGDLGAVWEFIDSVDASFAEYEADGVAAAAESRATRPVMAGRRAGGMGGGRGQRVLVHPSGFRMSPWADLVPAGTKTPTTKLWHTSPGSPG